MKKFLAVCAIGLALATGSVFADHPSGLGLGVVFGGGVGEYNAALSLKVPSVPIYWAIRLGIWDNSFGLGVTGDYYIIDNNLPVSGIDLGWYFGVGGYASLWGFDDKLGVIAGVRAPVGLSWQFLGHGEVFLEVAPQLGFQLLPKFRFPYASFFNGALGFRFWF
ncbi:MAG: hypothetical protein LBE74_03470 [Treponema sp.]|jgi:opacity protein-like surface antigen|nr:hypothetical protein [Treponema sp.]